MEGSEVDTPFAAHPTATRRRHYIALCQLQIDMDAFTIAPALPISTDEPESVLSEQETGDGSGGHSGCVVA